MQTVTVWGVAAWEPKITPTPTEAPRWTRRDNAACGSDSYGPSSCGLDSTCATSYDSTFCQRITSRPLYSNTTNADTRIASTTTSLRPIVVTSSSSDGLDGDTEATSSSTSFPSPTDDTSSSQDLPSSTPVPGDVPFPKCGILGLCGDPQSSLLPPINSPSPSGSTFTNQSLDQMRKTLPIAIPSVFLVICALIFSVVGRRQKWVSRAYRHLSRERRLRHSTQSIASPLVGDLSDDAMPLRDLEMPPPAYSPYNFSWADYELLAVDSPHPMGNPRYSESDMIGLAYPLGDMGRHGAG